MAPPEPVFIIQVAEPGCDRPAHGYTVFCDGIAHARYCELRGVHFADRQRARFAMRNHMTTADLAKGVTPESDYRLREWNYRQVMGPECYLCPEVTVWPDGTVETTRGFVHDGLVVRKKVA